ncbi:MAG: nuclear transport factor 2 family protein [Gaiellaceae bacterium]
MSTVTADNRTVAGTVQLYIDGVAKGDTTKLEQAFHQDARMYGSVDGQRFDIPISDMISMAASQPADVDGSYRATIRTVEEEKDAAIAILEEDGFWGALSFVDFFALANIDGSWKIVNKTFAHTGGSMPTD